MMKALDIARQGAGSRQEERKDALRRLPSVSVIIPARNAEGTIGPTLDALAAQDYAGVIEVIVADGSESPATSEIIRQFYPWVQLIPNPEKTLGAGANRGFDIAAGDVIVRCDAHTVFPPNYVSLAIETLKRTGAANVGGCQKAVGETLFERAVAMAMTTFLGVGDSRHRLGGKEGPSESAFLGVFSRETLDEMGGYDVSLIRNQDYEFNYRLRKKGKTIWFTPELVVEYKPRNTVKGLARQYFDYGRWKSVVIRKHPSSVRLRHLAAPLLVLGFTSGLLLAVAGFTWLLTGLLSAYMLTVLLGSAVVGLCRSDTAAFLLPLVLALMHLSWGVGFFIPPPPPPP